LPGREGKEKGNGAVKFVGEGGVIKMKIIKIKNCTKCPYVYDENDEMQVICEHPKIQGMIYIGTHKEVVKKNIILKNCPLEDYKNGSK